MIHNRVAFVIQALHHGEFWPNGHFHNARLFDRRSQAERKKRELDAADIKANKFTVRDILRVKIQVDDEKL